MKSNTIITQRAAGIVVGSSLLVIGFFFLVLGITLLPVVGLFLAGAVILFSVEFFRPRAGVAGAEAREQANAGAAYLWCIFSPHQYDDAVWCPWPPCPEKAS
jgi:membrane-bound ClpP family serine protease